MSESNWYVVHTYSGYENKVKANIEKTIENRHLEEQILEVKVPLTDVQETKNVGPGSKPVPLTPDEMRNLGIGGGKVEPAPKQKYLVDFEVGDTIVVFAGAWEGTTGMVTAVNAQKQTVTINVDMFGRPTPVEISFGEVKKK